MGGLQGDLGVNDAQCHGWCGIPGTLRSFSHTFIFLTKEPEKLNVMVCVFSKKGCDSICQKSLDYSLVRIVYFLRGVGEFRVWGNHWMESGEVRGRHDTWTSGTQGGSVMGGAPGADLSPLVSFSCLRLS